jgi:UDP-N-acetyl-D-mannosaminuronic acid transferase (WecB/TagA/CpsF family)
MNANIINFDGIRFFNEDYNFIIRLLKKKKGYLVIPGASSLVFIEKNLKYKEALQKSTAAIFDSGYFCLLIKILKFINVKKFSGYKFMKNFLSDNYFKKKKNFVIRSINKIFKK